MYKTHLNEQTDVYLCQIVVQLLINQLGKVTFQAPH